MPVTEGAQVERIAAERARYVAPGVTAPRLVVAEAEGARITDADGRRFLDFAGGIGCQNIGHRHPAVVEAVKEQADRYLHQCAVVGTYEPYVEVCRRLAELSPCRGDAQRSILVNSGAEAVENAVKIARYATRRQAVVVFDNAFHGRTLLAMSMTSKLVYKRGFGPFAPEVYRAPSPYPYRGVSVDAAIEGLEDSLPKRRRPAIRWRASCSSPSRARAGSSPCRPSTCSGFRRSAVSTGSCTSTTRCSPGIGRTAKMWAVEHFDGVEPDLVISGKSIGGGLPLAAVTGRAEIMDAVHVGGLGGTFGGNPLSCAAAAVVLDIVSSEEFLAQATRARRDVEGPPRRARRSPRRHRRGARSRRDAGVRIRGRSPERAQAVVSAAFERGLVLLSCGLYGNVVRLLPPLTISSDELDEGLAILEESLAA